MTGLQNSLNGTAEVGPAQELITETAEIMIRQSVLQELEKLKAKLTIAHDEEKPDPGKVIAPVKKKAKFSNCNSKENDKKRKKLIRDNINDEKNSKEQLMNYEKKNKESYT